MAKKTYRVDLIGAGGRGVHAYIKELLLSDIPTELAAIAEPDPENAARCAKALVEAGRDAPKVYADWRDMLGSEAAFDGMIITTPNHLHHAPAVDCMGNGIRVLGLEKPLATTIDDCTDILAVSRETGTRIQLGFVLRSVPFYAKAKELLEGNAIGRVSSVQADELVSFSTTAVMRRGGWRRFRRYAGSALLEKCCHDMDLLNWLMGSRPACINSVGGNLLFQSNPELARHCRDCPLAESCRYGKPEALKENEEEKYDREMVDYLEEKDLCVFNAGNELVDTQSVQIQYQNGTVANFVMNLHTGGPKARRNLHIVGAKGRIWGNMYEPVLYHYDNATDKTTEHEIRSDGSGHGGGDRKHMDGFLRMLAEPETLPTASVYDGYLSAMTCFAADRSMEEKRLVHLRYPSGDSVEIA